MKRNNVKKLMVMIFACALIWMFCLPCNAANIDEYYEDALEASGAKDLSEYLSEEAKDYLEKLGCNDIELQSFIDLSPDAVFRLIHDMIKNGIRTPLKGFMTASGTVLLAAICSAFIPENEKNKTIIGLISGCVIVTGVFVYSQDAINAVKSTLQICCGFEKALVPVLAGVVTACGNPTLALTYRGAGFAASQFISAFSENFALPLVGISGALGASGAMLPVLNLSAISEMIRKTMATALASAASLFVGFLSMKSLLSSTADGLITKGVKLAAGTFIPVVGGAVGEAYSSVAASFGLMKNTIGIYAVTAFFVICIPVILNLALWSLAMRAASVTGELLDCRVCAEILKNLSFVFSMLNTLLILCLTVFVISTGLIIAIKTGE